MKNIIHILLLISFLGLLSCENFLEPLQQSALLSDEQLMKDPSYLEGLLISAYNALPNNYNSFNLDVASDDAVTNVKGSNITAMATGAWKATSDPISVWNTSYEQIRQINLFLEKYESISWSFDPRLSKADNAEKNSYILQRLKGEAYGMRAYYEALLLQFHSGKSSDGTLLGFPILTQTLSPSDDWKLPRNTFAQCVEQIMNDLDVAINNLPANYVDIPNQAMYNAALGERFENRMNGNAAKALKARVALLAASPAYSFASGITWADAATIAGDLLKEMGELYPAGKTFYTEIRNKEIIWNQAVVQSRSAENNNFPPSLFGSGKTNPTQSLVDAFPMKNGYPINHELSGYNESDPYNSRDPRLSDYILYNDAKFKNQVINTYVGSSLDGVGSLQTSTRTGYYLKKFMLPGVSLTPGSLVSTSHTYTLFRMTEVLLNYAEAANEAWGPDGDPNGYGFTAKSKIAELRKRAGITTPDPYLNSLNDVSGLRDLIKNERRLELCFEGFRFWDLRRWNDLTQITKPATGVQIQSYDNIYSYDYFEVEPRIYLPFMIYGPVPYDETLKYNLVQNVGW